MPETWTAARKGRRRTALAGALLALFVAPGTGAGPALADDIGAARAIVREHCLDCHVVPGMAAGRLEPLEEAPAFQEIADHPGVWTEDRLRGFLRQPHRPMAGLVLSSGDIDNLIAFFHDLRGSAAAH